MDSILLFNSIGGKLEENQDATKRWTTGSTLDHEFVLLFINVPADNNTSVAVTCKHERGSAKPDLPAAAAKQKFPQIALLIDLDGKTRAEALSVLGVSAVAVGA